MNYKYYLSLLVSIVIVYILTPKFIPYLVKLKFRQAIREEGPESHIIKSGTPTMGGIIILISILFSYLIFVEKNTISFTFIIIVLGFGMIGFIDDYIKVVMKRNLGLRAYQKLLGQLIFATLLVMFQYKFGMMKSNIYIPIFKITFDLGWLYVPFTIFVVLGIVNSVNLTDGLDGLATGVTIIFMSFYILILILIKNILVIDSSLIELLFVIIGSCIGFLFYNKYPAKIFMGDVGSLALGGAVSAIVVLTGTYLLFPIVGGIYLAEILSVVIQVISFKLRGKRVFLMSPIHHHFEKKGWLEIIVVKRFWIFSFILGIISLIIVYL